MSVYRIECAECGNKATKKSKRAKYCSAACNQRAYEKRKGIKTPDFISKKKGVNKPELVHTQVNNVYQNYVDYEMAKVDPQVYELQQRKQKLQVKFSKVSLKNDRVHKWVKMSMTALGVYHGGKKLSKDATFQEVLIQVGGRALLYRYIGKNLVEHFVPKEDAKEISKLDQIKQEITNIDEQLSALQIQKHNEKLARQIAAKATNPEIERTESYTAMNAQEMQKIKRTIYKLDGKWKYFLGEIEQNFKAIIHGKPKQGKSHFAIQFAQYLHTNHGDVAYFAAEEGTSVTMENKSMRWNATYEVVYNILGIKGIGDYLKKHSPKFVFIDSISRLQLSADNINFLVDEYPNTAWIFVTQSTKHNGHRGSQELTHLVDAIIHVDKSVAYQQGRTVNGDTQLEVFDDNDNKQK